MARKTITTEWAGTAAPSEIVEPLLAKQNAGWTAEKPPYQNFNWAWQIFTNMLQNAEQNGIMEWSADTTFSQYGLSMGADGKVYQSRVAANQGNDPTTDTGANWLEWRRSGYLHVRDEKPSGTLGDAPFTSFAKVTLNTELTNSIGSTLSGSSIPLPAGTYRVKARVPFQRSTGYYTKRAVARLMNTTGAAELIIGTPVLMNREDLGSDTHGFSFVNGEFTLSVPSSIELQAKVDNSSSITVGAPASLGVVEVYSEVEIWEV